jgi:hypothetical protein
MIQGFRSRAMRSQRNPLKLGISVDAQRKAMPASENPTRPAT